MKVDRDAPKRPPLKYFGGKWRLASWIISHFPEHKNYVEPCGGGASVLLQKPISPLEVYNDLDSNVVNFFRCLRDNPDELIRAVRLTPYAREEFEDARTPSETPLENARRFFIGAWMSISCMPFDRATGMRTNTHADQSFVPATSLIAHTIDDLEKVANRLRYVQIEHGDAVKIIERYNNPDTLIYFDPPYVLSTRPTQKGYIQEATNELHINASMVLREFSGHVIISGYRCDLYQDLYEKYGWARQDLETQTIGGVNRTESLWLSPRTLLEANMPKQVSLF